MQIILRSGINLTKTFVTLALLCSLASAYATAQKTDQPLDPKSVAALVKELKEVVSQYAHDEKQTALVAQKWSERRDLVGNTQKAVIDLLWADVKSVVQDSGARYQIYSVFAFYKTIPDKMPTTETTETKGAVSKPESVRKLVDLTYRMHPYVGIEEQLTMLPGTTDINAATEEDRKNRIAGFEDALKANKTLTPEQTSFVRTNYDHLLKIADKVTEDAIKKNFPTEKWIEEGLKKGYSSKFTLKELSTLIDYFQSNSGEQVLKYVRISNMAEMITGNGGTLDLSEADKAEHDKFVATPTGKKFIEAYMKDAIAYEQSKENAVRSANPNADGFAIYEAENLNKLFNKFVAENYKK